MADKRFAITASDRYIGLFTTFLECGWEPIDSHMASNQISSGTAHASRVP